MGKESHSVDCAGQLGIKRQRDRERRVEGQKEARPQHMPYTLNKSSFEMNHRPKINVELNQ